MTVMDASRLPPEKANNLWFRYTRADSVIVFVHGVLSSSRTCWLSENRRSPEQSSYWPELIEKDTRSANMAIFLGGYHTSVDSGQYEVSNCVDELFGALKRSSKDRAAPLAKDKITFVCHSMGGVVVRSLIERHHDAFASKKVGLVLIASPSFGSHYANSLEWLIEFFDNQQGVHLKWGSWSLEDLDDRFRRLKASHRVPGLTGVEFYENHFIVHYKWMPLFSRRTVVPKQSQGRYFGAPIQIPDCDHFTICKPRSDSALIHQYLYDFLNENELLPTPSKTGGRKRNETDSVDGFYDTAHSPNVASNQKVRELTQSPDANDTGWLTSIKNYPAVRPHEIPYEVIEIFAKAFPTLAEAKAFVRSVSALRLALNLEKNTERQILILEEEFPTSPPNQIAFWSEILILAGGKSRRTLAAFTVAPNAPIAERYGNREAAIFREFQSKLEGASD